MTLTEKLFRVLNRVNPRVMRAAEQTLKAVPGVDARMEQEYASMLGKLEHALKPYAHEFDAYAELPPSGRAREDILREMQELKEREAPRWENGFVSGAVYHGDPPYIDFLNQVYALNSQSNPLHADLFPSTAKFEAEIVAMTAHLLGAHATNEIVGTVSSGGTESILLAMKTYRDRARDQKGITAPEIIAPISAHAAFDKAAQYFNLKLVHIPLRDDLRADVDAARRAVNKNTIALVGSAPCFPYGVVDPIPELSELAREHGIGFHTDACLGGFVLPFAEKLGYPVPPYDFRLPGVTSMSADTHKYGYAAKGASVVLYRGRALRHYQYYTATDWSGGLYFSPTFAGSRPGALSAAAWAALVSIGENGYLDATRKILETATKIKQGIREIPELKILGDPLWVIAFAVASHHPQRTSSREGDDLRSNTLNIYQVMDAMTQRGWSLNGLHKPAAVHIALTLRHAAPGVTERFVNDLRDAVAYVRAHPEDKGEMAPVYGLAANLPLRGVVSNLLKRYMDVLYKV
ncbi:MAG: aminotransferase class V-fold PLP-dependent enzyme [Chloroflexi bacterium]|nr:aminotransferase class V-fold PLP-dependent enzyme [Chloroflexota bacterium]